MSRAADEHSPLTKLFGGLVRQAKAAVDPLVAPYLPDRYYGRYGQLLADNVHQLNVLDGLPSASLSSGFFPLRITDEAGSSVRSSELFGQSARVVLAGLAGSGKSTALASLAWRLLAQPDESYNQLLTYRLFKESSRELVPVLVDLSSSDAEDLVDRFMAGLARFGFPIKREFALRKLEAGEVVLLLDHLEVAASPRLFAQLNELLRTYPRTMCLAAVRTGTDLGGLEGFSRCRLCGLEEGAVEPFVQHNLGDYASSARGLLAARERNPRMARLMSLPLMSAAMCRSLRGKAASAPRLQYLLAEALNALLVGWPARKERPGAVPAQAGDGLLIMLQHAAAELFRQGKSGMPRDAWVRSMAAAASGPSQTDAERAVDHALGAGLLYSRTGDGTLDLMDDLFGSFLAARWLASTGDSAQTGSWADSPQWHDALALTPGMLPDGVPLLHELEKAAHREPDKWYLLASAMAEMETCDDHLCDDVTERLFGLLEGEQEAEWPKAAAALAGMSRRRIRDHFSTLLRDPDSSDMRRRAALAMGRLKEQWAVPLLGAAISDADPAVRQQAAWALGHIPSARVADVLPRALRSPHDGVRKAAAEAMVRQAQTPDLVRGVVEDLIAALDVEREAPETVAEAEQALAQVGRAATAQLMEALGNRRLRPGQRSRVARALGLLGDDRALPVLIEAILSSPADQAEGYIEAVAGVGAAAVEPLIKALEGRDITSSLGLIRALTRIGAPAVGPLLEAIAAPSPEVRRSAVHALGDIGTPAIVPLTHAMLHDARYEVRRRALEILGRIGEADLGATLIDALKDPDPGVRMHAVRYLGNLKYAEATPALIAILHGEGDGQSLRREAINSLSAIGDERAIEPLLEVLDEAPLREAVRTALAEFSERAVPTLIEALHSTTNQERQAVVWDILEQIGQRGRPDDENLLGLASVYAQLRASPGDRERILSLSARMSWWEHGREVHGSLTTAVTAADVTTLRAISECGDVFAWLPEVDVWLRPHIREILWGLRDIVEDMNVYHKQTRRDSQRDALLTAIDRLEEMRELNTTMGLPFEQTLFDSAIARWHELMIETTKELRGRASLMIRLLTDRLPVRDLHQRTTAVFSIFNEGESAARNLSVSLRTMDVLGNGVKIVGDERSLDPLGIGEERHVEIPLIPGGVHNADLLFMARYDDDDRQRVSDRFSCRIEFYEASRTYTPIEQNPYIVGMPVRDRRMFFGRQDIFEWVRENISGKYQEQPLLLYGERRMGKTSVLYQLQANPPTTNHFCMLFDLQLYGYATSVQELLYELASAVTAHLSRHGVEIADPAWEAFEANPHRAFLAYADALDASLGDKRIVIMMDEFGVLMDKVRNGTFDASIFDYLRGVTQRSQRFTFIFTGAYEVRRMQQDFSSILFNMPKVRKISYLSEAEATDLIVEPVRGLIEYHPLVIQRIRNVTACHPYFIQYICQELVRLAQGEQRNYIELTDVEAVIQDVVKDATGNIENSIYNDLTESERLVLAALAHVTDEVRVFVLLGDIANMLERRHLGMLRDEILQSLRALRERDLVTETRIGQQLRYSFRMGLVRMWLRENEMLLRIAQQREGET